MTYTEFATDIKKNFKDYNRVKSNNRELRRQNAFLKNEIYKLQEKKKTIIVKTDIEQSIYLVVKCINKEIPCESWMLSAQSRKEEIRLPRQIAMYILRNEIGITHANIGLHCGGRDHSTVISACRIIENYMETSRIMGGKIKKIIEHFKNENPN